jgi:branched-chain amino acid transport system substrate-binding protein
MHEAAVGAQNVTELISDAQVAGIVGPFNSSVAVAELPLTNLAPIALISPTNTADCLTRSDGACSGASNKLSQYRPTGKVNYFRLSTGDRFQGGALAEFALRKSYRKVYIIDDTETYGTSIAQAFENKFKALGGTVVGHQKVPSTTSYATLLTMIAAAGPDAIFFGGGESTGGRVIRTQMKQSALANTPFLCGDGCKTSGFAQAIGNTGGPVFSANAVIDVIAREKITDTKVKDFLSKYEKAYGLEGVTSYSVSSYDCAMVVIQAIKAALEKGARTPTDGNDAATGKAFREAVIAQIARMTYTGVTGTHSFDENGDTTLRVIMIYTIGQDVNKRDGWSVIDEVRVTQE